MLDKLFWDIRQGNAIDVLKSLDKQVHCVVTSPPYYKKRRYGDSKSEVGYQGSVDEFIASLCDIFDTVPLHDRGSVWVNLGDTRGDDSGLLLVPERFAMAMVSKGWKIADHVVWAKQVTNEDGTTLGGCMIEPAPGRLNGNSHEMLFRFVKTDSALGAWTDTCAVRIPRVKGNVESIRYLPSSLMKVVTSITGRNLSNVWRFPMGQTRDDHYAVYSSSLCERPIAMTCPMFVGADGFLRERIIEMVEYDENKTNYSSPDIFGEETKSSKRAIGKYTKTKGKKRSGRCDTGRNYTPKYPKTIGWTGPDNAEYGPGVVLDPFSGTGSTGQAALLLGRNYIGIDLYEKFVSRSIDSCESTLRYIKRHELNPFKGNENG